MPDPSPEAIASFITRWEKSGGAEKSNSTTFLTELCDQILLVPHPDPCGPDNPKNLYVFERTVTHKDADGTTSSGFIDLYKAGCFVLESKQGTFQKAAEAGTLLDFIPTSSAKTTAAQKTGHGRRGTAAFDKVLTRAYNQARKYITALPAAEGRPPFLIVCDVGHTIDLYAEFSGTGGQYERFPDPVSHRITLADLHRPEIRDRLRRVWTDPHSLDPAKHAAAVTRQVSKALAELAKSLDQPAELGGDPAFEMASFKVGPRQFLGLEINRRAVAIAQLVLWIGFFQWQRRTTGKADTNERPLLPKEATILHQDAVLAYDATIARKDPVTGAEITIWDGHTTKPHPVTGKTVPDESARRAVLDYTNPRRASWPEADVVVGNPPFIGKGERMRDLLGEGYVDALRKAWKGLVPESADFVMFWWQRAAELVDQGKIKKFGLITTNSIHQTFNRRVVEPFLSNKKSPSHLVFAIPDHPWVDSSDGAAVRISMTVLEKGEGAGILGEVTLEKAKEDGSMKWLYQKKAELLVQIYKSEQPLLLQWRWFQIQIFLRWA